MRDLKPILYAGAIVGVLDITAACINARVLAGFPPAHVLQSVAGGLLGRGTYNGGFATALLGLAMHFTMALTVAAIFYALTRRFSLPKKLLGVVAAQSLSAYTDLVQAPNGLVAIGHSPVLRRPAHCAGDASILIGSPTVVVTASTRYSIILSEVASV